MKAIAVKPNREKSLDIINFPKPDIDETEVLIKTLSLGIDGTDIEISEGLYGQAPEGEDFLIIGHEAVGKVIDTGTKVTKTKIGDYVVPTVRRNCPNELNNEPDMCQSDNYLERGIKGIHGYASEFFKEKPENLLTIPKNMTDYGMLIEPLSIAEKAISQIFKIQERFSWQPKAALVTGAGPLGLLAAIILRLKGIKTYVYDIVEDSSQKARIAKETGSKYINGNKIDIRAIPAFFEKPDIIFEATGNSKIAFSAAEILNFNGIIALLSVATAKHSETICPGCLNNHLVLGNRVIFGSVSSNKTHFEMAIKTLSLALKQWPEIFNRLISNRLNINDFKSAFKRYSSNIKSVIYF